MVKNTYRTLLTRGLKGCYIYFLDKNTERFVRSRTEALGVMPREQQTGIEQTLAFATTASQTGGPTPGSDSERKVLPFRRLRPPEVQYYVNSVPLVDLKFAAGTFSEAQTIDPDEVEWIELPDIFRPRPGLFVAQVIGESMNRRIPNGSWCLFRLNPAGTRQGKVVVAQHRSIHDPDLGGSYTVKIYQSRKKASDDGEWEHEGITLIPDSTDPKYQPIELDSASAAQVQVIADLIAVLPNGE